MKGTIWVIGLILFLGFSVYCYHVRTNWNVDAYEQKNSELKHDVEILSYALSITPKETRNEVFFNSVKDKFPDVEERGKIIGLIKLAEAREEKKEVATAQESRTIGSTLDGIIKDVKPTSTGE